MSSRKQLFLAFALALSAAPLALQAAGDDAGIIGVHSGTYGDVPYLTGGIGLGEREYMSSRAGAYNLKLELAARNGEYLSDVEVRITDARGNKVLESTVDGPWLFARLAPDKYKVEATSDNRTFAKWVRVNGQHMARVVLNGWQPE